MFTSIRTISECYFKKSSFDKRTLIGTLSYGIGKTIPPTSPLLYDYTYTVQDM